MAEINRSLLKALEVFELVAEARDGLRVTDIADRTGYPASTAHRLLATLVKCSYVEQDPATRRYHLGLKMLTLQAEAIQHRHLGRRAVPYLRKLRQRLAETVNLGVPAGSSVVYLESLASDSSFGLYVRPGTQAPLHCTAMGKSLLAHASPEARESLLASMELTRFTPRTITALSALREELKGTETQGYAVDDEEYSLGVRCLAAPIYDHTAKVRGAVSITAPSARLQPERYGDVGSLVRETCLDISRALGYRIPAEGDANKVGSS